MTENHDLRILGRLAASRSGEVGTGKTVAIRSAVADLDPASHTVIYIGNPATGVRGILAHVVTALGGKPVHGTAALAVQAWSVLAGEAAERGRTPVLAGVPWTAAICCRALSRSPASAAAEAWAPVRCRRAPPTAAVRRSADGT